ncbi:MAG: hypothetical protein V3T23_06325 [Nitrososphaerales archaeon]
MTLGPAYGDGFAGFSNDEDFIYVKGNERTDGSLRLKPDLSVDNIEFQMRTTGVWNDTGIQIAASSVHMGRDLLLSGAGEFLQTINLINQNPALIPHVPFSDLTGTLSPSAPILSPKVVRTGFSRVEADEITGTDLQEVLIVPFILITNKLYFKTGSIGATADITITIRRGEDTSGIVIWERAFPATLMSAANTEFSFDLGILMGGTEGEFAHVQFQSENDISLATSATFEVLRAADIFLLQEEDLIQDIQTISREADLTFDREGNWIVANVLTRVMAIGAQNV